MKENVTHEINKALNYLEENISIVPEEFHLELKETVFFCRNELKGLKNVQQQPK